MLFLHGLQLCASVPETSENIVTAGEMDHVEGLRLPSIPRFVNCQLTLSSLEPIGDLERVTFQGLVSLRNVPWCGNKWGGREGRGGTEKWLKE